MNPLRKIPVSILPIIVYTLLISCKKKEKEMMNEGPTVMLNQQQTIASDTVGKGTFSSYEHGLGGSAILYNEKGGEKILRLTNFNMTPGPDVYIYLSKTTSYSSANVITVTKLTSGYANSYVNFPVSNSGYSSAYKYILVYCVQYSSLFGYAELK